MLEYEKKKMSSNSVTFDSDQCRELEEMIARLKNEIVFSGTDLTRRDQAQRREETKKVVGPGAE